MGLWARFKNLMAKEVIHTLVRRFDGSGDKETQRPLFNHHQAVAAFANWVYVAIGLRVDEIQRHQLRLLVRKKNATNRYGMRTLVWGSQKVPAQRRRFYEGQVKGNEPSTIARTKLANMGPDGYEEVIDHPALSVLRTANDFATGSDLTYLRWAYLYLAGNTYIVPTYNKVDTPDGLWVLPSQWVRIQPDPEKFIKGYVFGTEKQNEQVFGVDEVLHQKLPNPKDRYYGYGPTEAAWSALGLHWAKRAEDQAAKENRGHPDYLAVIKSGADEKIIKRFEAHWRRMMNRGSDSAKMATITGDVDLKQLNFPPEVLGDPDRVLDEIAGCFKITRAMLTGNENVPGGGPETADYQFLRSIAADLKRDEQFLNERWLPLFDIEDDACLVYDNPLPEDSAFQLQEDTQLVAAGIRTINEARDIRGDQPIEGGEIPRINGTPLDKVGEVQNPFGGLFSIGQPAPPKPASDPKPEPAPPSVAPPKPSGEGEAAQNVVEGEKLNGAQITAAKDIISDLVAGVIPDLVALELLIAVGISEDKARRMVEAALAFKPDKPQEQPAVAPAEGNTDGKKVDRLADGSDPKVEKGEATEAGASVPSQEAQPDVPAPAVQMSDHVWGSWESGAKCCGNGEGVAPRWASYVKVPADDAERDGEEPDVIEDMASELAGLLGTMRERIVGVIANSEKAHVKLRNSDLDDIERIIREMEESIGNAVRPFTAQAITAGAAAGLAAISLPASTFQVTNPAVEAALREFSENLAGGVASSTVRQIRSTLADGVASGESVGQLTARVDDSGLFSRARSEAIARSESARAFVEGEVQGWKQSGVVQGKRWRLAPGACPYCRETARRFNNRTVDLDEPFYEKGSVLQPAGERPMKLDYAAVNGPPLHPNDRCGVEPVLIDNPLARRPGE